MIELLNGPEQTLDVGKHTFGPFAVPANQNIFRCHLKQVNWPIVKPYLVKLALHTSHDGDAPRESWALIDGTPAIDEDTKQPTDDVFFQISLGCVSTNNPENPHERRVRLTNDKATFAVVLDVIAPIRTAVRIVVDQDMPSDPPQHIVDVPEFLK